MHSFVQFLRRFTHFLSVFIFTILLFGVIPVISVTSTLSDPENVKSWLADSNLYENIIDNGLETLRFEEELENVQIEGPDEFTVYGKTLATTIEEAGIFSVQEVKDALKRAVDTNFVRAEVEEFIDGIYNWLSGDTERPEYRISLQERIPTFTEEARSLISNKLDALPECGPEDIDQLDEDFNPFTAVCLPPGNQIQQEIDRFIAEFSESDSPLSEEITGLDLEISDEDSDLAQRIYSTIETLPLAYLGVFVLIAGIAILTARPWFIGVRRLGVSMVVNAVILLIILLFVVPSGYTIVEAAIDEGNVCSGETSSCIDTDGITEAERQAAHNVFDPLLDEIIGDLTSSAMQLTILVLVLGIIGIGVGEYVRRNTVVSAHMDTHGLSKKHDLDESFTDHPDHPDHDTSQTAAEEVTKPEEPEPDKSETKKDTKKQSSKTKTAKSKDAKLKKKS